MTSRVPWFPHSLHEYVGSADELRQKWCYVVLEEAVDGTALLLRWPWPVADEQGRLYWPEHDRKPVPEAAVPLALLKRQLYEPNRLRRMPRVGDTFAARQSRRQAWETPGLLDDVRVLFPDTVVDVSADARAAAKLAYHGSLVPPVPKGHMEPEVVRQATAERRRLSARELKAVPPPRQSSSQGNGG